MTSRLVVVASALVLGSLAAQPLMAQTAASSPTREEVKSQVRAGDKPITGDRMPTADQLPPKPKNATREQRKAERAKAREARKPEATEAAKKLDETGGVYNPATAPKK